uniref:FSA_C domain-containing protein n=1 Tax=Echinostoma caproni TaxID=27848 RepID=A0A183AT41_9TREM
LQDYWVEDLACLIQSHEDLLVKRMQNVSTSEATVDHSTMLAPLDYKPDADLLHSDLAPQSTSDSGLEFRTQPIFMFKMPRAPRDSLKFILTKWYSPETSSLIADSISACCTEAQLKKLIAGPLRDIMRFAEKHFMELNI